MEQQEWLAIAAALERNADCLPDWHERILTLLTQLFVRE
jgi:hypothetical protein